MIDILHKYKIKEIIKSCETEQQLNNTASWLKNIINYLAVSNEDVALFKKMLDAKKCQIKNNLATKYKYFRKRM